MSPRTNIEIGLVTTVMSTLAAVEYGRVAELQGFDWVAFGGTASKIYHPAYPAVVALLLRSQRIKVQLGGHNS